MKTTTIRTLLVVCCCLAFALTARAQSTECTMCQMAVEYVDGYLMQNYTQTQIIKQLEVVCALAPPNVRQSCDAIIATYLPALVRLVTSLETPKAACDQLGLCAAVLLPADHHPLNRPLAEVSSNNINKNKNNKNKRPSNGANGESCFLCTMAVGALDGFLAEKGKAGPDEVEAYLEHLCHLVPTPADCVRAVRTYAKFALAFVNKADAHAVCQQLDMCGSN